MMAQSRILAKVDDVVALARRLEACPEVSRLSTGDHDEPSTLAHALSDLEESFVTIRDELLPKLVQASKGDRSDNEVLLDISEELRHILYHIKDARFFRHLETDGLSSTGR